MTREDIKELLPIIQAYAEGKTIELYIKGKDEWRVLNAPTFTSYPSHYRIKPEPQYRPFKSQEECWQEMLKHEPFGWLKTKNEYCSSLIGKVYANKEVWIVWATDERNAYSASNLFNDYTFADGSPFGIKE